ADPVVLDLCQPSLPTLGSQDILVRRPLRSDFDGGQLAAEIFEVPTQQPARNAAQHALVADLRHAGRSDAGRRGVHQAPPPTGGKTSIASVSRNAVSSPCARYGASRPLTITWTWRASFP